MCMCMCMCTSNEGVYVAARVNSELIRDQIKTKKSTTLVLSEGVSYSGSVKCSVVWCGVIVEAETEAVWRWCC